MRPGIPQQHAGKGRLHREYTATHGENDEKKREEISKCVQMAANSPNGGSARLLCGTIYAHDDQSRDSFIHNNRSHSESWVSPCKKTPIPCHIAFPKRPSGPCIHLANMPQSDPPLTLSCLEMQVHHCKSIVHRPSHPSPSSAPFPHPPIGSVVPGDVARGCRPSSDQPPPHQIYCSIPRSRSTSPVPNHMCAFAASVESII